jgi:predicted enzyme related to lactoylglutathione lyase
MARRTTAVIGAPCWIDILTSDVQRTRDFYTQLMGWTADEPDPQFGGYFSFRKDGVIVAGGFGRQEGMEAPDCWTIYIAVADARATVETARANGAQVFAEAMDVGDLGVMAVLVDPTGAPIGLWQPKAHQGFGIVYEPGGPAWFELHTTQYQRALDFYRSVFGWNLNTMSDTAEFRYSVLQIGEDQLAGVMDDSVFAPQGSPSYWLTYLAVEDTDAALARVRNLGGTVTRDAEDTPYGRLASVTDPTGATLNVMGPNVGAAAPAGA